MRLLKYLDELATHVRTRVDGETQVRVMGSGVGRTVAVAPGKAGACGVTVLVQGEDEMSVEFGEMSILDFIDEVPEDLYLSCREIVDAIIDGRVSEVIYLKGVEPVRAMAHLELPDRVIKVHTRRGFSVLLRRGNTHHYEPYSTRSLGPRG
ncbi:hypothetical protein AB0B27_22320 [Micromonospora rifamycinica]|uniref:hypothetical protein n=1 Tax=Micromonospora rifamycinica TaxID=291594 RepID=UPI0033FA27C5